MVGRTRGAHRKVAARKGKEAKARTQFVTVGTTAIHPAAIFAAGAECHNTGKSAHRCTLCSSPGHPASKCNQNTGGTSSSVRVVQVYNVAGEEEMASGLGDEMV